MFLLIAQPLKSLWLLVVVVVAVVEVQMWGVAVAVLADSCRNP
jgi:hypothetical protein